MRLKYVLELVKKIAETGSVHYKQNFQRVLPNEEINDEVLDQVAALKNVTSIRQYLLHHE